MSKKKETVGNPYRAPTSDLDDGFTDSQGWSSFEVRNAKKYVRCIYLGSLSAIYASIIVIGLVDVLLPGSEGSMGAKAFLAFLALPIVLLLSIPLGVLYVDYKKSRSTVKKFVTSKLEELERWYNKPIIHTFGIWIGSGIILIVDVWDLNPLEIDFRLLAANSVALLAFPLFMPIVYFMVKSTLQRARRLLDQMSQEL